MPASIPNTEPEALPAVIAKYTMTTPKTSTPRDSDGKRRSMTTCST